MTQLMTHRRTVELAAWLAAHGATIATQCRGIPVAALRAYLKARRRQCDAWSGSLGDSHQSVRSVRSVLPVRSSDDLRHTLEEVATSAILLRVFGTIVHAIGQRLDIPLAIDVAGQTARAHDAVVKRSMAIIAVEMCLSCEELTELDRLGGTADRLSDLLCGAMLPTLECDRFVVDRERAQDFAETFGRKPALIHVAIQQAMQCLPGTALSGDAAEEVERSLKLCLPIVSTWTDPRQLNEHKPKHTSGFRLIRLGKRSDQVRNQEGRCRSIAFPSHSFARSRQRLRDSTRE